MASIGDTLKQAREKRGIAIADVHGATKITPQNLIALEEDRLEAFPNRVYARAFLRDYANFLGLESAPLLEQYEVRFAPEEQESPTKANQATSKSVDGAGTLVRAFAIVVILVVVALAVWRPVANFVQRKSRTSVAHVQTPAPPAPPATPKPALPTATTASNPTPVAPKPVVAPAVPQGARLVVDALTDSWIKVVVDGHLAFMGNLPAFKQKSWQAAKTIEFRTGNAGGVRLTFNGKKLQQIGLSGHIAERKFVAPPPTVAPAAVSRPAAHNP
jgi:cytoskeletal protein RodZ